MAMRVVGVIAIVAVYEEVASGATHQCTMATTGISIGRSAITVTISFTRSTTARAFIFRPPIHVMSESDER